MNVKTTLAFLVAPALALSLSGAPAFAQSGAWVTNGPSGGSVTALAVDPAQPAIVYAATGNGVFRSQNGGGSWSDRSQGLGNRSATSLAIDPRTTSTLYAGTVGGLFKSTDSGGTWSALGGPVGTAISSIVINPITSSELYVSAAGVIHKSIDAGVTWQPARNGIRFNTVTALAIDPSTPATLYAGSHDGAFKSVDAGASWTALQGIYTGGLFIPAIAVDPQVPATLYAANFDGATVYKSLDAGTTWSPSNGGLSNVRVNRLAITPGATSTVYAGAAMGVYKTINGGAAWTVQNDGLDFADKFVLSVAVDPQTPGIVYAGFRGPGVFKTTDGAGVWLSANAGLGNTQVLSLQVASGGGAVVAGTSNGVHQSGDGGHTWRQLEGALRAQALAIDPRGSSTLYAGGSLGTSSAVFQSGVFKSVDGGFEWALVGLSGINVFTLAVDPVNPDIVYAGTTSSDGVFRSADGGATWAAVNGGLTSRNIFSLTIDPRTPTTIYAGTGQSFPDPCRGVFKTMDSGASWVEIGPFNRVISAVVVHPDTPDILYAASPQQACQGGGPDDPGIFKSTDGGASWVAVHDQLTSRLVVDPLSPDTIYAGSNAGVFRSRDAGATWAPFNEGLSSLSVTALALAGDTAFDGTEAGGVSTRHVPHFALSVKRAPMRGAGVILGSGTVASSPAGIDCGPDCSQLYLESTSVTLTATPAHGSNFHHWDGCDSTDGATCTVTLTANRIVSAVFVGRPVWGGTGRGPGKSQAEPIEIAGVAQDPAIDLLASVPESGLTRLYADPDGRLIAIADFNGDDVDDLAWLDDPGVVWLGNGDGTYRRTLRVSRRQPYL